MHKPRPPVVRPPFRSTVRDAFRLRCPYCRQGPVLERWPNKILPRCPQCGLSYFRESGYFIGGMVITYALTLAIVIPAFLLSLLLPEIIGLSDYARLGLWILFALPLSFVLMPYAYSLWLSLDFWLEPWKPRRPI
ncbi:MAG: DUF983 domain-containing protein [Candidatus Acidiferrales bacterium]